MLHEDIVSKEKWANLARWERAAERTRALHARRLHVLLVLRSFSARSAVADVADDLQFSALAVVEFLGFGFCCCSASSPLCVRRWPTRMSAMLDLIMCAKEPGATWHKKECIDRTCALCGDDADGKWRGWERHGVCAAIRRSNPDTNFRIHEYAPHRNTQAAADGKKQLVLARYAGEPRDVLITKYIEVLRHGGDIVDMMLSGDAGWTPRSFGLHHRPRPPPSPPGARCPTPTPPFA